MHWSLRPVLVLAAVLGGCAPSGGAWVEREVASGGTVAALVGSADTAVVLLYDPADVFACRGSLQPWLEWARGRPDAFALVFTRPPTAAERTQLATYRVRPSAILRARVTDRWNRPPTPTEALLVRGRVAYEQPVARGGLTTALYRRLATHTGRPPASTGIPGGAR